MNSHTIVFIGKCFKFCALLFNIIKIPTSFASSFSDGCAQQVMMSVTNAAWTCQWQVQHGDDVSTRCSKAWCQLYMQQRNYVGESYSKEDISDRCNKGTCQWQLQQGNEVNDGWSKHVSDRYSKRMMSVKVAKKTWCQWQMQQRNYVSDRCSYGMSVTDAAWDVTDRCKQKMSGNM